MIHGADAAVPFNYGTLPAGVRVILGYVGGATPHAWTPAEIYGARGTGRAWWGIWTAPNPDVVLGSGNGVADGAGTVAALRARSYPLDDPVFYDVERSCWDASATGALAAVASWKSVLRSAGYERCYSYGPPGLGDWVADWGAPQEIPAGAVGLQYQGGTTFDLSVFVDELLLPVSGRKVRDMIVVQVDQGTVPRGKTAPHGWFTFNGERLAYVQQPVGSVNNGENLLRALGQASVCEITYSQYAEWLAL